MIPYKIILASIGIGVAFIGYIPYFRGMFAGRTKPHAFSWLIWTILVSIAFAAQLSESGGAGSWVTGSSALLCFLVFLFAFVKGDRKFVLFDWMSLFLAFCAIALWVITNDPTFSIILVVVSDALGFLPSFRKAYLLPHEETASLYAFASIKFFLSLISLERFVLATWLFPAYLMVTNALFVVYLLWRRRVLLLAPVKEKTVG